MCARWTVSLGTEMELERSSCQAPARGELSLMEEARILFHGAPNLMQEEQALSYSSSQSGGGGGKQATYP